MPVGKIEGAACIEGAHGVGEESALRDKLTRREPDWCRVRNTIHPVRGKIYSLFQIYLDQSALNTCSQLQSWCFASSRMRR